MNKTIGLFLDSSNLYHNTNMKFPRRKINYPKIYERFVTDTKAIPYKAVVYGVQKDQKEAHKFIQKLHYEGFSTEFLTNEKIKKNWTLRGDLVGCWDCGLTVDVMKAVLTRKVDEVVIGSNSNSLNRLIREIKDQVKVTVIASRLSDYTKNLCDCVEIEEDLLL